MGLTFSSDKCLTFQPVIRWQLNCHPFWYNLTLVLILKQYEVKDIPVFLNKCVSLKLNKMAAELPLLMV